MDSYNSGLPGATLAAAITARSQSLTLSGVPSGLPSGTYPFQLDSELMLGTYPGIGRAFSIPPEQRGLEGTTAAAHRAGIRVHHPVTGAALNQLARATREAEALRYVRSPAARAFLGANFS